MAPVPSHLAHIMLYTLQGWMLYVGIAFLSHFTIFVLPMKSTSPQPSAFSSFFPVAPAYVEPASVANNLAWYCA